MSKNYQRCKYKLPLKILITAIVIIFCVYAIIETYKDYDYLESKTKWCYNQDGVMDGINCVRKDRWEVIEYSNIIIK